MKTIKFYAAVGMLFAAMSVNATDLWTGNKHVSWGDGGLQIQAASFASAKAGDKIVVTFASADENIEFKVMNSHFDHLAGSREAMGIAGKTNLEQFLTKTAVDSLKLYGLEIIGANFIVTKVELNEGKANLHEGYTVWTGYFWADDWKTLELYRDGYCNADLANATALRVYSEASSAGYIINFKQNWEAGGTFAETNDFTFGDGYAELTLTPELRTAMAAAPHWMIQFNKESLDAFNVTDVVLVTTAPTGVEETVAAVKAQKMIENGQLVLIKNGVRYNALGTKL